MLCAGPSTERFWAKLCIALTATFSVFQVLFGQRLTGLCIFIVSLSVCHVSAAVVVSGTSAVSHCWRSHSSSWPLILAIAVMPFCAQRSVEQGGHASSRIRHQRCDFDAKRERERERESIWVFDLPVNLNVLVSTWNFLRVLVVTHFRKWLVQ